MVRLKHASYRLAFRRDERIIDIALDSPEAFSRAFRQAFGQSPSQFRKNPQWQTWNQQFHMPKQTRSKRMDVNIVDFEKTRVAIMVHRGTPEQVNNSVMRFIE